MTGSYGHVIITHRSSRSYSACSSCRSSIWKNFSALNQTGLGVLNPASPANGRDPALQGQGSLWSRELGSIEESYISKHRAGRMCHMTRHMNRQHQNNSNHSSLHSVATTPYPRPLLQSVLRLLWLELLLER